MSNLDIRFLENLNQRLKTGSRRSIYLNALVGRYLTRLDLSDLNLIEPALSRSFLDGLLGQPKSSTTLRLSPEKLQSPEVQKLMRRLNAISIENRDYFEEYGIDSFSFGFPMILRRDSKDPSLIIKAPMFIWSLNLQRNWRKANEWILERGDDFSIVSNFPLTAHVYNDAQIQLSPVYDHLTDDCVLDKEELSGLIYQHYSQLIFGERPELKAIFRTALDTELQAMPTAEEAEAMDLSEPKIIWAGIFGLFKAQKESIINDIANYIDNFGNLQQQLNKLDTGKVHGKSTFMKHTFSPLVTDPSQQQMLHSLGRGENLIIQGPPGTGKSQTLTSIISNAISNGGRCLVVCEKKTAMEVLQKNLQNLGLGELSVIVEDVYRDRTALVSSVRERMQTQHPKYLPSPNYIRLMQSCANQIQRLQKSHEKLITPICGNEPWSAVVTAFLKEEKEFPKDILESYLKPGDFKFNPEELASLLRIIREAEPLYKTLGTLQHPFNAFHERYFEIPNSHQVFEELKKAVKALLYAVDGAQRDLLTYLYKYEKLLDDHYTEVLAQKGILIDEIIDMIEAGMGESKYFFNKNNGAYRNFLSGFSSKFKKLKEDKLTVLKNYSLLINLHARFHYFKHDFLDLKNIDKMTFEDLKKNTQDYYEKLSSWYSSKDNAIRNYVNKLSEKNLHPYVDFKKEVKELTRNLDLFAQNFMKSQVFKVPFGFKNIVVRERLNNLEELDKNLKSLDEKYDEDFPNYHPLKYFWLQLDQAQQAAFTALAKANPANWEAAFSGWYRYHLLNSFADDSIPQEMTYRSLSRNLSKELNDLRPAMISHTLQFWRSKQSEAVRKFNSEKSPVKVHSLYNLRGNSGGRRTPLRQIFEADPNLFTAFYPVLMVSPAVCASMLPLVPGLFDVVIFDEASQLRLEDTFAALTRGSYKVVSGDSQQMPPSDYFLSAKNLIQEEELTEELAEYDNKQLKKDAVDYLSGAESLLEYCIADGNYKEKFLQVHYRSAHPYLIDFSNAAFYGKKLMPVAPKTDYKPISFFEMDGLYEKGTNRQEAKAVLERLLTIYRNAVNSGDPIPSIGVATFNILQRNLILELMQEKSLSDADAGTAFEALFAAGLFVKNLENIQGEERDYMLLSTTFGKAADGSFLQNFGPLNRELGYRLLNVIITRAKKYLEIYSSIPTENYGRFREHLGEGKSGRGLFYAYLAYAKAVSDNDETARLAILKQISDKSVQPLHQISYQIDGEGSFEKLLFDKLESKIPEGHSLQQNADYMGFNIPLLISNSEGKPVLAIYTDLFNNAYSEEAYAWDMFREECLQNLSLKVCRIWSYSCWKNLEGELQRVLAEAGYI